MKHRLFPLLALALAATAIRAQEVCGGILGIPCDDPQEFCQLADGECCCDFQGVCTVIPTGCPDVFDPVCGCDGVTYGNRCEASMAGMSVAHPCACDRSPAVVLTAFSEIHELVWAPLPGALAYNVYVERVNVPPTTFTGSCLYTAVADDSVLLQGNPRPGELWLFQLTGLFPAEGPLGFSAGCSAQTPASPCICSLPADPGPCDAAIPRWFHNFETQQCELFTWGGCGGNANNFLTQADCEAACRDACDQPAVAGSCAKQVDRWYYDGLTGHCELFAWSGCGGNANNFETEQNCQAACGDICLLPADPGPCAAFCPRWFYNSDTGQCEEFVWGCCGGNANNFATQAECEAECSR